MEIDFNKNKEKIKQIEWDETYAYISCEIKEEAKFSCDSWIEVDLNTTGHLLVASHPQTGKILKLGKKGLHIHQKYKNIRKKLQKKRNIEHSKN